MRYLVKVRGRTIDYVPVYKGMKLEKKDNKIRVVYPKKSVWFTGYKVIRAKSYKRAIEKAVSESER